jgi:hypothetical protein
VTISFSGFVICVCFVSSVREGQGLLLSISKVSERGEEIEKVCLLSVCDHFLCCHLMLVGSRSISVSLWL